MEIVTVFVAVCKATQLEVGQSALVYSPVPERFDDQQTNIFAFAGLEADSPWPEVYWVRKINFNLVPPLVRVDYDMASDEPMQCN
ncbi:hypothetical protein ASF27_11750 [Methylobacterium sp. Leaf102]|nr:hypothetical protein ASF27_11750 [Methylobacterium sp. Leaf102]